MRTTRAMTAALGLAAVAALASCSGDSDAARGAAAARRASTTSTTASSTTTTSTTTTTTTTLPPVTTTTWSVSSADLALSAHRFYCSSMRSLGYANPVDQYGQPCEILPAQPDWEAIGECMASTPSELVYQRCSGL